MALGTVTGNQNYNRSVCVLYNQTTQNGQPTLDTDGVEMIPARPGAADAGISYRYQPALRASISLKVVASGGTVSGLFRLWGYHKPLGEWVPLGVGDDSTKGVLNDGAAVGAVVTNKALHTEDLSNMAFYDRLYVQVVSISGTAASAEAWVTVAQEVV